MGPRDAAAALARMRIAAATLPGSVTGIQDAPMTAARVVSGGLLAPGPIVVTRRGSRSGFALITHRRRHRRDPNLMVAPVQFFAVLRVVRVTV